MLGGVIIATNLTEMPRGLDDFLQTRLSVKNILLIVAFGWSWSLLFTLSGLHDRWRLSSGEGEWPRLMLAGTLGSAVALVFPVTSRSGAVSAWHILLFGVIAVPAAWLCRSVFRSVDGRSDRVRPRHVLIVGSGPLAARLYRQVVADRSRNTSVIGFVDSDPQGALAHCADFRGPVTDDAPLSCLGTVEDLERILMRRVVDDVLIGLPVKSRYDDIQLSLAMCARVGVPASYSADLFGASEVHEQPADWTDSVLSLSSTPHPELLAMKRVMDVVGAAVLLILLAPVMIVVAFAIVITSPGPVLFAQDRYGYMKRLFRMYKFRTMVVDAEQLQVELEDRNEVSGPVFKIRNDPRITPIGRFLRRTSLDELPQLWSVLTGEMSLVGPRPLPMRDVGRFADPWLMRRFSMRPGLTCIWQVSGRSSIGFEKWIELDLEYIDTWSLAGDIRLLLRTIPAVLRGSGAA